MKSIRITNAITNNLKNVSINIPLEKLVVVVGKSGSGKSSLVHDVIYKSYRGEKIEAKISRLPKIFMIEQKLKPAKGLSLGETNLSKLEKIIKEAVSGDLLIVDEPCAGMAKEDRMHILQLLRNVVNKKTSVIVVEHNKDIIANADYIIEFGPGAGNDGGNVIFEGSIEKYKKTKTPTSTYAFSKKAERVDYKRNPNQKAIKMQRHSIAIKGINKNNFKNYTLHLPLGSLVCICGRTGTGKSTLLSVTYGALYKGKNAWRLREGYNSVLGKTNTRRSYFVDQSLLSPIKTSTPATYLGVWENIREVYANLPVSKKLKLTKSHFSFNVGLFKIQFNKTKKARFNGYSIFNLLDLTVRQATKIFSEFPLVVRKLGFLDEVGLGYLTLGQRSATLSGGEAQRVRLAKILSKKLGDRCIYILDIPSRGLHLSDLPTLVKVFQKIIDENNTVLVAENREELLNNCDHIIRLPYKKLKRYQSASS